MCTMYQFWNIFSDKNCYNVFMNTELWQRHPKCSQTSWVDTSNTLKDHYVRSEDLHIIVDNTGSKVTDETTTVCLLFKKIVKIVICLPAKHLEFLWTCLNVSVHSRSNWNLEVLVLRRGDNWSTWKKPLGARERTNNKLNPHMASMPGYEQRPHRWEASAHHCTILAQLSHGNHGDKMW